MRVGRFVRHLSGRDRLMAFTRARHRRIELALAIGATLLTALFGIAAFLVPDSPTFAGVDEHDKAELKGTFALLSGAEADENTVCVYVSPASGGKPRQIGCHDRSMNRGAFLETATSFSSSAPTPVAGRRVRASRRVAA